VELADKFPIRRMSPMQTPLPRADDAAVAHVEPGGMSMPASQRHLLMNPLKVHDGVRTTDIKEKSVVANVQNVSFFHEGADDGHWADRLVLSPGSEANERTEASDSVCLGERCWH
jgi:hypothetical protein